MWDHVDSRLELYHTDSALRWQSRRDGRADIMDTTTKENTLC